MDRAKRVKTEHGKTQDTAELEAEAAYLPSLRQSMQYGAR
jgi:hypothetical protein